MRAAGAADGSRCMGGAADFNPRGPAGGARRGRIMRSLSLPVSRCPATLVAPLPLPPPPCAASGRCGSSVGAGAARSWRCRSVPACGPAATACARPCSTG